MCSFFRGGGGGMFGKRKILGFATSNISEVAVRGTFYDELQPFSGQDYLH